MVSVLRQVVRAQIKLVPVRAHTIRVVHPHFVCRSRHRFPRQNFAYDLQFRWLRHARLFVLHARCFRRDISLRFWIHAYLDLSRVVLRKTVARLRSYVDPLSVHHYDIPHRCRHAVPAHRIRCAVRIQPLDFLQYLAVLVAARFPRSVAFRRSYDRKLYLSVRLRRTVRKVIARRRSVVEFAMLVVRIPALHRDDIVLRLLHCAVQQRRPLDH